jgi:hypothetical protein
MAKPDPFQLNIAAGTTGSITGPDITNAGGHRGVTVVVDTTVIGTGSWTVTIQGRDRGSGKYYTLLASAAISSNVTTRLTVYPGIPVVANVTASDVIPESFRVIVTGNANPVTGTISGCTLA